MLNGRTPWKLPEVRTKHRTIRLSFALLRAAAGNSHFTDGKLRLVGSRPTQAFRSWAAAAGRVVCARDSTVPLARSWDTRRPGRPAKPRRRNARRKCSWYLWWRRFRINRKRTARNYNSQEPARCTLLDAGGAAAIVRRRGEAVAEAVGL